MIQLSYDQKLDLYRLIESTDVFEELCREGSFPSVISRVWDIHNMPSEDSRYTTKFEDIQKHYVDNRDYSYEELFLSKLNVLKDDKLEKLITSILSDAGFGNHEMRSEFAKKINDILVKFGSHLIEKTDYNGNIIYIFDEKENDIKPVDLLPNGIKIYIDTNAAYPTNKKENHRNPPSYPSLVLAYDYWKDWDCRMQFDVFYHTDNSHCLLVGKTKILINENLNQQINSENLEKITNYLPIGQDGFIDSVPEYACSLGQDESFYSNLVKYIGDIGKIRSLLWSLRDAAIYPSLQEKHENAYLWSGLTRENTADRMLRYGRHILYGETGHSNFSFTYRYKPPYSDNLLDVIFDFSKRRYFPNRIYAIIGKNGSGKTQLLSSIPRDLKIRTPEAFSGTIPRFGKIIAISNSYFDNFEIPVGDADFNYVYCGLSEVLEGKRVPLEMGTIIDRIIDNFRNIIRQGRYNFLFSILKKVFTEDFLDPVLDDSDFPKFDQSKENFLIKQVNKLSSGETDILYFFSSLLRHIRSDSLILFDEPENHLHPNIISAEMEMLQTIAEKFDSYVIIATHTPILLREIRADNVFVVERMESACYISKIGMETLGGNLTQITDYVFGNKGIPLLYRATIDNMVDKKESFEDIVNEVRSGNLPLNPSLEMYIAAKILLSKDNNIEK